MSNSVEKLARKLGSHELAEKLVEAGLKNPRLIRQATDREVRAAVGRGSLAAVRAVFPRG